jgi:hypothetical protein
MTRRNRTWLRRMGVDLGARATEEHISADAIALQEDTVLSALDILEREPGVLLADEVGMGKTYQALALVALAVKRAREEGRSPRVLVVTPRAVLNEQWLGAAQRFDEQGFFPFRETLGRIRAFQAVGHIHHLAEACRKHAVVFAPVTIFTSARSQGERGFLLEAWMRHRKLSGSTRAAIRRKLEKAGVKFWPQEHFLGCDHNKLSSVPRAAWRRRSGRDGSRGLDDLYGQGLDAFSSGWAVKGALNRARFHHVRHLLPSIFDLLVVDEAHKLKNPWTVQSQAVSQVLQGRYAKALFLTATPFQLGVGELRRVFELFACASRVRAGFEKDKDELFAGIADYQEGYGELEDAWRYATPEHSTALASWYLQARGAPITVDEPPGLDGLVDPNVLALARLAWRLRVIKDGVVEPGFRRWTVRSLKPGKKERRNEQATPIQPDGRSVVPLLLHERLLLERSRTGHRTHVTAAATNIASSFAAAKEGSLVREQGLPASVQAYQEVLDGVLAGLHGEHPKVEWGLQESMLAADKRAEKTLVFCERIATIEVLAREIEARWRAWILDQWRRVDGVNPSLNQVELFGEGSGSERQRGLVEVVRARFQSGRNPLCLALRESYAHTLFVRPGEHRLPRGLWPARRKLLRRANELVATLRVSDSDIKRLDYRLARRCVDKAVAEWVEVHDKGRFTVLAPYARNLLDERYLRYGLDLEDSEEERSMVGSADRPVEWRLTMRTFEAILRPPNRSIWFPVREALGAMPVDERSALVVAMRSFLTRREVPFLPQLLRRSGGKDASAEQIRKALEEWWRKPSCMWMKRLEDLVEYLPALSRQERLDVFDKALSTGSFVQHTNQKIPRSRLQHAFNTPFFPMVLVGNKQLQEGLNLHRQCRRVIHHDLRWNPADIEQRTGRVDRHGSLSQRMYEGSNGEGGHIEVGIPLLTRTVDPRRYQRVKDREKWLEFLLGRPPELGVADLDAEPLPPLPVELAEDLRVDLGPRRG